MTVITQINMLIDRHEGNFTDCESAGCEICQKIQSLRKEVDKSKKTRPAVKERLGAEVKREARITAEDIALAASNGIPEKTLRSRVYVQKMPAKTAATTPMRPKSIFTKEEIERAKQNGIGYPTLLVRKRLGWDRERTLTEPPDPKRNGRKNKTASERGERRELNSK